MERAPVPTIGIGYRTQLAPWIELCPGNVECLEITASDFYKGSQRRILFLGSKFSLIVRGGGLSLGTPGPLNLSELGWFSSVVAAADPLWITEPLGFSRTAEVDLFSSNPVCPNQQTLEILVDHVLEVMERFRKRVLLENISSHLRIHGSMAETELLNSLCDRTGCGILLDVTNLLVNSRNHGFDPRCWIRELNPETIVQLRLAGHSSRDGRWEDIVQDSIQDDLWTLVGDVISYAPPTAITLEWDRHFPILQIERELRTLRETALQARMAPTGQILSTGKIART